MNATPVNVHATAVVIGTTGLLFVGPSASGKSAMAHACLSQARSRGIFAALVADDQVLVSTHYGRLVATRPETIRGLIELRGTGIASVPSIRRARLDWAISSGSLSTMERLPAEHERFEVRDGMTLPLLRLPMETQSPFDTMARFVPFLGLLQ
jgi:serine kinase of HPr protein (carbohydrate metabolism regulator)